MSDQELFDKIESLNKEQLSHVQVFVEYLVEKAKKMKEGKLYLQDDLNENINLAADKEAAYKTSKTKLK